MQAHSCDVSTVDIAVETGDRRVTTDLMCGLLLVSTFFRFFGVVHESGECDHFPDADVAMRSVDAEG